MATIGFAQPLYNVTAAPSATSMGYLVTTTDIPLTGDRIYSGRSHVNVYTFTRDALNNHFPPASNRNKREFPTVEDYLQNCVRKTIASLRLPAIAGRGGLDNCRIAIIKRAAFDRGEYRYCVYAKRTNDPSDHRPNILGEYPCSGYVRECTCIGVIPN